MAKGYFTVPISEHLEETPEGFLIARDCVIARTGWQTYKVGDLPQDAAKDMGVDVRDKQADIDLYRPADEVFHPDTLRSFEGKPVTDNHPQGFVDPSNFSEHSRGHVQNVRKGKEPLESGEWPMVGDVHVMAEPLLSKVRNKIVRELSCGYDYSIRKDGDKICQIDIQGNHVAVVPKGRAGNEARINDSAAEPTEPVQTTSTATALPTPVTKEKKPVKVNLKHIFGLGLKAFAADASPEEVTEAAKALHEEPSAESKDDNVFKSADAKARDRQRHHDALDRALDKAECGTSTTENPAAKDKALDSRALDKDMEDLRRVLKDAFGEEEPEDDDDNTDEDETEVDDEDEDEEVVERSESEDDEDDEGKGEVTEKSGREVVTDRASAADGAQAVLRVLRPYVARSRDAQMKQAFNSALAETSRVSKARTGGYDKFGASARTLSGKVPPRPQNMRGHAADSGGLPDRNLALQQAYDAERSKGGK